MIYRELGKTGMRASALGFGCMRLPMTVKDGKSMVDDELAGPLLRRAVELGINFFDSHWFYCDFDSQRAVGAALREVRDKVYISTKTNMMAMDKADDFDNYLEKSLEQMELDYLDCYHLPALTYRTWKEKVLPMGLLDRAEKAKSKGLIKHISFSFHSDPDKISELIDTGVFSTMLGQYNILDRRNEEAFAYAKSKGVGTMVMGPLMGGVFTDGGETFLKRMGSEASSAAEMGLRFVWGNPDIDVVLSGMSNLQQLEENVEYVNRAEGVLEQERRQLIEKSHELRELNDLYCTGCNYCAGCPEKIQIGRVFQLYLQHHIWGLTDAVRKVRGQGNPWTGPWVDPSVCTACGRCQDRCPQKIDIPTELRRVWPVVRDL